MPTLVHFNDPVDAKACGLLCRVPSKRYTTQEAVCSEPVRAIIAAMPFNGQC